MDGPVAPTTKGNTRRILRYGNRHHYKAEEAQPMGAAKRATLECRWVVFVETRGGWPAGEPAGTVERVTFNVDGVLHHRVQAPYELTWCGPSLAALHAAASVTCEVCAW
jgi:hypothetical protein